MDRERIRYPDNKLRVVMKYSNHNNKGKMSVTFVQSLNLYILLYLELGFESRPGQVSDLKLTK